MGGSQPQHVPHSIVLGVGQRQQELLAGLGGVHIGLNNEYCFGDSDMARLGIPVPLGTDNASLKKMSFKGLFLKSSSWAQEGIINVWQTQKLAGWLGHTASK